ncbi:NAD(P)H:quinone oxidoreductase [Sesamum angolense]|uniref:NAD(P)H dehydrogenase (quinone) n=1 Tax=Sesamum angolense TaxID=2727404 RepID=A0AAE2BIK1_9LAMI|nr:NAD(P)H:quinone oxidoreductase [Sesamum angolense]
MALVVTSSAGFFGSSQAVQEGSLRLSGSGRLSMTKQNSIPSARAGLTVRALQQNPAETETSRRSMLGLLAAGFASTSFVETVLARPDPHIPRSVSTAPVRIAGIPGSLREGSLNKRLINAASEIAKTISPTIEVEYVDIDSLPLINTDLVKNKKYPAEVEAFFKKLRSVDGILFASPEYNYSVAGWDLGGARSQYHLRQIGIRPDIYFINSPEVFVNESTPVFDSDGNFTDDSVQKKLKELLVSLNNFTLRLRPCSVYPRPWPVPLEQPADALD